MVIEVNYTRTVTTQRKSGQVYEDHLEDIACHIQPLDESYTEDLQGNFGKNWLMFCPVLDILEGDRIVEGDETYRVVTVKSFNFLHQDRHMEIQIRKSND